jgi:hypothetical protein
MSLARWLVGLVWETTPKLYDKPPKPPAMPCRWFLSFWGLRFLVGDAGIANGFWAAARDRQDREIAVQRDN